MSSSSDYDHVIAGSLKLKSKGSVVKRPNSTLLTQSKGPAAKSSAPHVQVSSHSSSSNIVGPTKTPSELAFEAIQRQRIKEKAKKMALKSHKEKVADFNKHLESLSEHYDVPKVGPG